ncbi:hypothetical protein DOY81_009182 [Sarcophaga bullata]|nr:hypothetical protein DOY81_009182 [Sarcophaga bullata]
MDDCRKTKKRLFSIFEKAKKLNNLNEASHSNKGCIPPDSSDNYTYDFAKNDFENIKLVSTPQKQKAKISKSPSFTERIEKYFINQPSSAPNQKPTISCDTISGVAGNVELEVDNIENLKDDIDLEDSFLSDSFLDTIDTNAIVEMINTTEIFETETQVQNEDMKKYESKSKENFKPLENLESKLDNVSRKKDGCLPKTRTKSNISKKNKKGIESSILHSLKTRGSSPVTKTYKKPKKPEKYYSIFRQNERIDSMTTNMGNEQNTHSISGNGIEMLLTGSGSRQVNERSGKQQKTTNKDLNENGVVKGPARKRGRPPSSKSVKVAVKKQPKTRIKKINVAKKPKNTYGKLSEDKLSSVEIRKIPQHFLDEVLDMLQNEDHEVWQDRNISCNAGIHRYWETRPMVSDKNMKLKYARQFLLRREWLNLSKILCLFNRDEKNNIYYPLLVKYATLCLAHTDKEQFQEFVNSLASITDSSAIIKKCTNISQQH